MLLVHQINPLVESPIVWRSMEEPFFFKQTSIYKKQKMHFLSRICPDAFWGLSSARQELQWAGGAVLRFRHMNLK